MLKAPIAAGGGVLTGIGAASVATGNPLGLLMVAAGMTVTGIANSIQVNPTSGERMLKLTDQALLDTALTTATAFVGGAGAKMASMGRIAQSSSQIATGAVGAGTAIARAGATYSSSGAFSGGFNFSGNQGTSALLAGMGSAIGSYAGSQIKVGGIQGALYNDAVSTGLGIGTEYGKYKAWGADQSGFMGMFNVDGNRFGALGGMALSVEMNKRIAQQEQDQAKIQKQRAIDALKTNQKHQARDIIAGMGYTGARREQMLQSLEYEIAYNERNIDSTSATYKAREVASQMGLAKDGRGQLYRDVQKELNRIVGKGEQASYADIQKAAENVARAKGLDITGKQVDWNGVNEGHFSAVDADLRNRPAPKVDNSVVFMPVVLSDGTSYGITYNSATDKAGVQTSAETRARGARQETFMPGLGPAGAVDGRSNIPMKYWVEAQQRKVQNAKNFEIANQLYKHLEIDGPKTLVQSVSDEIMYRRMIAAGGRMTWGTIEAISGAGMALAGGAGTVLSIGTASPVSVPAIVGGAGFAVHGVSEVIAAGAEMYSASVGGRKVNSALREGFYLASGHDVEEIGYVDDAISIVGGVRGVAKLGSLVAGQTISTKAIGITAAFGGTASGGGTLIGNTGAHLINTWGTSEFGLPDSNTALNGVYDSAVLGTKFGATMAPFSSIGVKGALATHLGRASAGGLYAGGFTLANQYVQSGDFNFYSAGLTSALAFGGVGLSSMFAASHGAQSFRGVLLRPDVGYAAEYGSGALFLGPSLLMSSGISAYERRRGN
jgi:hypothetical protein